MDIKANESLTRGERRKKIVDIISKHGVRNQEELIQLLKEEGIIASQASVSRDIKDLNITKIEGAYILSTEAMLIQNDSRLNQVFRNDVMGILLSPQTIAIKTRPGYARSTAALIEKVFGNEVFGTISGEDCVIIIANEGFYEVIETYLTDRLD